MIGTNRIHAILGTSEHCIATHPSDMCVALAALEGNRQRGGAGRRAPSRLPSFIVCPATRPRSTPICGVTRSSLPSSCRPSFTTHYTYLKLRDRLSYAFALVAVAVALQIENGAIAQARLALGGVAHKPWRNTDAETLLRGKPATTDNFAAAADLILKEARGYEHNAFKIELARRAIVRALSQAAAGAAVPNRQAHSIERCHVASQNLCWHGAKPR